MVHSETTSESICSLFGDIGFTVEHDYGRVVEGFLSVNDDKKHMFILRVDVESKTFGLACSSELIRQTIITQQGFDSNDDLKQMLAKNRILTDHRSE